MRVGETPTGLRRWLCSLSFDGQGKCLVTQLMAARCGVRFIGCSLQAAGAVTRNWAWGPMSTPSSCLYSHIIRAHMFQPSRMLITAKPAVVGDLGPLDPGAFVLGLDRGIGEG